MISKYFDYQKAMYLIILSVAVLVGTVGVNFLSTSSSTVFADQAQTNVKNCGHSFFGLEPWFQYMGNELDPTTCDVKCFNFTDQSVKNDCGQTASDVPAILLAIIDDLLRIAGLAAVGFVFYGAFKYVGSQGNPETTAQAQSTIINALIGVAIASIAVLVVNFIGSQF